MLSALRYDSSSVMDTEDAGQFRWVSTHPLGGAVVPDV